MDNSNIDIILSKKLDDYNTRKEDFLAPGEFTVTISLNEYRNLVYSNATKENAIREANSEWAKYKQENEKLKKEVDKLKAHICELTMEQEKGEE